GSSVSGVYIHTKSRILPEHLLSTGRQLAGILRHVFRRDAEQRLFISKGIGSLARARRIIVGWRLYRSSIRRNGTRLVTCLNRTPDSQFITQPGNLIGAQRCHCTLAQPQSTQYRHACHFQFHKSAACNCCFGGGKYEGTSSLRLPIHHVRVWICGAPTPATLRISITNTSPPETFRSVLIYCMNGLSQLFKAPFAIHCTIWATTSSGNGR